MSEAGHKGIVSSEILDGTACGLQQIAQVLKSNGSDGDLIFSFRNIDPDDFETEEPVFIFFDGLPVPFYIESFIKKGKAKAVVKLTGINTFEDASELEGKGVFSFKDSYGEYDDDDFSMLVGWRVINQDGVYVGVVEEYMDIPGNPCIEVSVSEEYKEKTPCSGTFMIPLHEDLILAVDEESKEIEMAIPSGLI